MNLPLAVSKANTFWGFWISQLSNIDSTLRMQGWQVNCQIKCISLWARLKVNKSRPIIFMFLCSECCFISELKPVATGEMQSDPERGWELCSIYNARCTRLSSWINLTGMNAPHWDYNMGANGRVMSALPSHWDRIPQQPQQEEN